MPSPELKQNSITISVDRTSNTIDVTYNDLDPWNNLMTCVLGLGALYNRCVEAGYSEKQVHDAMMTNLIGAIANFKSAGNEHTGF
jgi:maltoporin